MSKRQRVEPSPKPSPEAKRAEHWLKFVRSGECKTQFDFFTSDLEHLSCVFGIQSSGFDDRADEWSGRRCREFAFKLASTTPGQHFMMRHVGFCKVTCFTRFIELKSRRLLQIDVGQIYNTMLPCPCNSYPPDPNQPEEEKKRLKRREKKDVKIDWKKEREELKFYLANGTVKVILRNIFLDADVCKQIKAHPKNTHFCTDELSCKLCQNLILLVAVFLKYKVKEQSGIPFENIMIAISGKGCHVFTRGQLSVQTHARMVLDRIKHTVLASEGAVFSKFNAVLRQMGFEKGATDFVPELDESVTLSSNHLLRLPGSPKAVGGYISTVISEKGERITLSPDHFSATEK